MSEQRLIDAKNLMKTIKQHNYLLRNLLNSTDYGMFTLGIQQAVDEQPTIDLETLPIVQELQAELEQVKKERDELASLSGKLVFLCDPPKEWRDRLFMRIQGRMLGDYMGSGYPFVDAFNRIYTEFEEKSSDGAYEALKKAAEVELQERS